MTLDEYLSHMRKVASPQKDWAAEKKISAAYLSDVLNKRRDPGQSILEASGFEKIVTYRKKAHK